MKPMFAVAMICAGFATPLAATAQGGSMMGGSNGGSTMGVTSSMRGETSMTGAAVVMPIRSASPASAGMSQGEVRKVDSAAGKLTLRQDAPENVDIPAMTMVFRVRNPAWLQHLQVGDKVRFVAERVDGRLTIVALEPQDK
jgi:Cu/Ag efflux protein CusF